ncbi:MAG: hypothetical protein ACRDTO_00235 [Mycobacterium sp.]
MDPMESSFYCQPHMSSAIMRLAHLPDGVLPLLQMESLATREAASIFDCSMIVEFGCYDGRALEVARFSGTRYLGVDKDEGAIAQLRERIDDERLRDLARAIIGDVLDPRTWHGAVVDPKPLHLLPFNLLGNFRDPRRLLESLSTVGGLAMFSMFNTSHLTNNIRHDYYTRCGVRDLQCTTTADGGVLFTGDAGFYSRSFGDEAFRYLLEEAGATMLQTTRNCVGQCVAVLLSDKQVTERGTARANEVAGLLAELERRRSCGDRSTPAAAHLPSATDHHG